MMQTDPERPPLTLDSHQIGPEMMQNARVLMRITAEMMPIGLRRLRRARILMRKTVQPPRPGAEMMQTWREHRPLTPESQQIARVCIIQTLVPRSLAG